MSEQHYIITLKKGANKEEIFDEMSRDTSEDSSVNSNVVPDRKVDTVDSRSSSKRVFEMALTDEEANKLRNDPRLGDLNLDFKWDDDWMDYELNPRTSWVRNSTSTSRNNWGLLRHTETTNGWTTANSAHATRTTYDGHLDGTGVDYVHQEGSVPRPTHEYMEDASGTSRFQSFQWNTLPNMSGMQTVNYNTNGGSHATHCAGTAIGKGVGWATNAKVYALPTSSVSRAYWFDAIKEFHKAKTADPTTGVKRPTVVSASWGYKALFDDITATYFRGYNAYNTVRDQRLGMIGQATWNGFQVVYRFNAQIYNLMAEVEEMQDEGVIYCKSAGNQGQKLCGPTDQDYNNYITRSTYTGGINSGQPVYYNRGAGNLGPDTIVVGNLDSAFYSSGSTNEATQTSSDKGPRVDVWVAGTNIVSGGTSSDSYYYNTSGTSMSTPQLAGMTCLLLQANPGMTPAQVRAWWQNNSQTGLLYQGPTNEGNYSGNPTQGGGTTSQDLADLLNFYGDSRSLQNGPNRIAYFPYNAHASKSFNMNLSGPISF